MIPSMGVSTRYQQRNTTMRKARVIVPGKNTKFIPIVPTPGDDSRKIFMNNSEVHQATATKLR